MKTKPLDIVYNPATINRVKQFFAADQKSRAAELHLAGTSACLLVNCDPLFIIEPSPCGATYDSEPRSPGFETRLGQLVSSLGKEQIGTARWSLKSQ